jgi:predicted ATPase
MVLCEKVVLMEEARDVVLCQPFARIMDSDTKSSLVLRATTLEQNTGPIQQYAKLRYDLICHLMSC